MKGLYWLLAIGGVVYALTRAVERYEDSGWAERFDRAFEPRALTSPEPNRLTELFVEPAEATTGDVLTAGGR